MVKLLVVLNDSEVIIMALKKERDELHDRLMQIDRIINGLNRMNLREIMCK